MTGQSNLNARPFRLLGMEPLVGSSDNRLGRAVHVVLAQPPREGHWDLLPIQVQFIRIHTRSDQLDLIRRILQENYEEFIAPPRAATVQLNSQATTIEHFANLK
jgi:hypothetical protein